MTINVLYFAAAKDAAGTSAETVPVEDGATIGSLAGVLQRRHPALGSLRGLRYAMDERFATPESPLADGATVALLPPVSGG